MAQHQARVAPYASLVMLTLRLFGLDVLELTWASPDPDPPETATGLPFGFSGGSGLFAERTLDCGCGDE